MISCHDLSKPRLFEASSLIRDVDDTLTDKEEGYDYYGRLVYRRYYDSNGLQHGRETFWGEDHRVARTREWVHGSLHGLDTVFNDGMKKIAVEYVRGEAVHLIGFCQSTGNEIFRTMATIEGRYDVKDPLAKLPAGHRNLFTWRPVGIYGLVDP